MVVKHFNTQYFAKLNGLTNQVCFIRSTKLCKIKGSNLYSFFSTKIPFHFGK